MNFISQAYICLPTIILPHRNIPVHMMKKIRPNPAKIEPNTADKISFVKLLFSLGLFTRYLYRGKHYIFYGHMYTTRVSYKISFIAFMLNSLFIKEIHFEVFKKIINAMWMINILLLHSKLFLFIWYIRIWNKKASNNFLECLKISFLIKKRW